MPAIPPTLGRNPAAPRTRPPDFRPDSTERGYSYRWKKYSRERLARFPICAACEASDRSTLAACTDHIRPISDAGERDPLFWDADNHQSLCWPCHSRKTAKERHAGLTR
jgi:5-methylcytosine-specific restriction protein A